MSETAKPDEIDALVSSVRKLVAHKEQAVLRRQTKSELLILTQEHRVKEDGAVETSVKYKPAVDEAPSNVLQLDPRLTAAAPAEVAHGAPVAQAVDSPAQPADLGGDDAANVFDDQAQSDSLPMVDVAALISDQVAVAVTAALDARADAAPPPITQDDLRDMVTEIIRAELAGALGEKITGSVRKLVRREIHRVFAAKALD